LEKTFTNLTVGGPVRIYVKDGKIVRVSPLLLDDGDARSWVIKAGGRQFRPLRKACIAPFTAGEKARVYSDLRIKYPMIRADFNPGGQRHPENRGRSEYRRVDWNTALDVIAGEMKRIREKYGPEAVMSRASSHHNWGNVGYRTSTWARFFSILGFTDIMDNPDSWEGWHWGATHAYGFYWRLGMPEQYDLLEDALKNTEMVVHWGNDPDSTRGIYGGQESVLWRYWLRDLGKKQVFIDPFCNYTATILGDKWIAPRPGTDAAMAEAIAYVWLTEGTYEKKYIASHSSGFDEFKRHILGEEDGVAKTPGWAEAICDVPAYTIVSLAREWASKRTMLAAGSRGGESGACRQAYGTEWARLMVLLQAMRGLGKPGVNIWGTTMGSPFNASFKFPGYAAFGPNFLNGFARNKVENPVTQRVYRLLAPDAILNPPIHWMGQTFSGQSLEQQFIPYTYPEPGRSEVKMFYRYGGSYMSTMTETGRWVRMYQSPKLEFVVNQDCWWCNETRFADVILPACTNFERNDIGEWANTGGYTHHGSNACNHRIVVYQQKCIEPLYESKSDYRILAELAEKLGIGTEFTEGNSEEDWVEKVFNFSDLPQYISFKEFKEKGYFIVPVPGDYRPTPGLRWFYEGRDCDTPDHFNPKRNTSKGKELGTYSGKIEFVSQSLTSGLPDDKERPPLPRYIASWEGYNSPLAEKYPLQLISPHPRYSFHTHNDVNTSWLGEISGHRVWKDGHNWRPVRINSSDAASRGIKQGDIVRIFNDRGAVLCIAEVSERMRPGVVHCYYGSGLYDPIEPGNPDSPDRGGCVSILTPSRVMSKNAPGMAPNSCLVEVERWKEEIKSQSSKVKDTDQKSKTKRI
jgi:molybdopterin guanine dinucleotide-containing S/N-oxide reductase-like protein